MDNKSLIIIILIVVIVVCISVFSMATLGLSSNHNETVNVTTSSVTADRISQDSEVSSSDEGSSSQQKSTADLAREWSGTSDGRVSDVISDGDQRKADYLNSQIDHTEGNRVYYKDGSSAEFVDKS